tara:strand:+ start:2137 stop:2601 length:465 start_codon:yes stop_codon:yes gene_type:complete
MIKDSKILSIIIFLTLYLFIVTFSFDQVPEILAQGMQPTMMPRLIFSLIILLSIFQIYQNRNLIDKKKEAIKRNAYLTFCFMAFMILIAEKLGFFLTVFVFTLVTPFLWQRKDKLNVFLYSIGMTIFVFVFFTLILQLKFPQGILEDFIVRNFY